MCGNEIDRSRAQTLPQWGEGDEKRAQGCFGPPPLSLAGDAAELVCCLSELDAFALGVGFLGGAPWARVVCGGREADVDVPVLVVALRSAAVLRFSALTV